MNNENCVSAFAELPYGLSVVVPVYRSEQCLPELVAGLQAVLQTLNMPYELIFVNDCSPDNSWQVICDLAAANPEWIRGMSMLRNAGQHAAVLAGLRDARYALTVTMDDDLQHEPKVIPQLIAALGDNYDVMYAYPEKQQHGMFRDYCSRFYKWLLTTALKLRSVKNISAYRLVRTNLREAFLLYEGPNPSVDALLTWGTTRFSSILVPHKQRAYGQSNYTLSKLIMHAVRVLTSFSVWPLHLASILGFACTLLGVGIMGYVIIVYFISSHGVPGFPFLASITSIFAGVQLFCIGIIGEYLAGMYMRSFRRPTYTLYQRTENNKNKN